MPRIPITDVAEPRLEIYRDLHHPDAGKRGTRFIVEGEILVRRLLESDFVCDTILSADRKADALERLVRPDVTIFTAPDAVIARVLGFKFHSGVMASAMRRPSKEIKDVVPAKDKKALVVVCPELTDGTNLGSIVRITAAFAADALLIGPRCRDPFYRQSVRVSMGTIFTLPVVRSTDLVRDLRWLRDEAAFNLMATVLDSDALPLRQAEQTRRTALLFGNEALGLERELVAECDRKLIIPMRPGVDSLNVAVTAGIFLYHFSGE